MIYICESCKFIFERQGEVVQCPGCGSGHIRPADAEEQKQYIENRGQNH